MAADMISISRDEYEDLVDALDHANAMRNVASGNLETVPSTEVDRYLAAPTPLAFWRAYRGLTSATLAERAGLIESELDKIETGMVVPGIMVYVRLAKLLKVRVDDLVPGEDEPGTNIA